MSRNDSPSRGGVDPWVVPGAAVGIGLAYLVIAVAHGDVVKGVLELLVMVTFAAAIVLWRGRSEAAALMGGDTSDERRAQIQVRSSAMTGNVLVLLVVAGLFWSLATDNRYVGVFTTLAVAGGVTAIASTVWYSRRG